MKKFYLLLSALFMLSLTVQTQTVEFFDDFESGAGNWVFSGMNNQWGLTITQYTSPTHSLTDSPFGNYLNDLESYATMANGVDLGTALSAELSFWAIYDIEAGFDYMYVDVSTDDFASFVNIATFDSIHLIPWIEYTYDLGGYVGNTDVKVRFRFLTDGAETPDGMYIDDFEIVSDSVDSSPPLIITTLPVWYQGSLNDYIVKADLIDISGIASAELKYKSDGNWGTPIVGVNTAGTDEYTFTIPMQVPGSSVDYYIEAMDVSASANVAVSDTGRYIAGNYVAYDNGVVDFFGSIGPGATNPSPDGAAVRVTFGNTDLVTMLIRNYTSVNEPNDPMEVHVWTDNGGVPGIDVISPIMVAPEATLTNTSAYTRIDLRGYAGALSGLSGDYFIGYTNTTGVTNLTMTQPGLFDRSYSRDPATGVWSLAMGSGGNSDYHFRAITSADIDVVPPMINNLTSHPFYEGVFGDMLIETVITDNMSGVDQSSVVLQYTADGVAQTDISGINTTGNTYMFTIPQQSAGTMVHYTITAADQALPANMFVTDTSKYIAGEYFKYDDGSVDFFGRVYADQTQGMTGAAVRISPGGTTNLVTALIRNYDATGNDPPEAPNDPFEFHVWANNAGSPGADILTPFMVTPWADTATNVRAYVVIDLRPYANELSNLVGDFFIGYTVPVGGCNLMMKQPGDFNRTFIFDGTMWINEPNFSDYHFRCVTSGTSSGVVDMEENDASVLIYPNPSDGQFNFALHGMSGSKTTINIYDLTGKQVYSVNKDGTGFSFVHLVDLSQLSEGMYIAEIQNGDNVYKKKIIVR